MLYVSKNVLALHSERMEHYFIIMEQEIWKDVVGFEGLYQVSNLGRVRSLGHDAWHKGKVLKPHLDGMGHYYMVGLSRNSHTKHKLVHRLVAEAFIPNHNNYPQVNHKDENKTNNVAWNLEWCTNEYNINYNNGAAMKRAIKTRYERYDSKELVEKAKATKRERGSFSAEIPVNQFTWDGKFVARFISATEAMKKTGVQMHVIAKNCKGRYKQAGGFIWLYDKDVDKINEKILYAHPNAKKVAQYDLDGNLVKIWNSATEACKVIGVSPASLSECCNGKRRMTKNYIWKFI